MRSAPNESVAPNLAQRSADALTAQLWRWPQGEPAHGIPLLFKLVDFATVLAGPNYWLTLHREGSKACVSTDPRHHLRAPPATGTQRVALPGTDGAELLITAKAAASTDAAATKAFRQQLAEFLETAHGTAGTMTGIVAQALDALVETTPPPNAETPFCAQEPAALPDDARNALLGIANVCVQSARTFAHPPSFGLRYWDGVAWQVTRVSSVAGSANPFAELFDAEETATAQAAFLTGLVQVCRRGDGLELFVPCHFGGVPWFVAAYPCANLEEVYFNYRDINSLVNTVVRTVALPMFVEELRSRFRSAVADDEKVPHAQLREAIRAKWDPLGMVYPLATPRLTAPGAARSADDAFLEFNDGEWVVDLSGYAKNPFATTTPPLEGARGATWSSQGVAMIRDFVRNAADQLRAQSRREKESLAAATYVVGHPLKLRLNAVLSKAAALGRHLAECDPSNPAACKMIEAIEQQLRHCVHLSKMMNLIASWQQADTQDQLRRDFLSPEPLDLNPMLRAGPHEFWIKNRPVMLNVSPDLGAGPVALQPWSPTRSGTFRLSAFVYEEIFFELLANAAARSLKHLKEVQISVEDGVLVFSNRAAWSPHPPSEGKWYPWRDGEAGGLRFISEVLQVTEAGSIEVRRDQDGTEMTFRVRVRLKGLEFGKVVAR